MNDGNIGNLVKELLNYKSKAELFSQQLALLENSFFDSLTVLYRNEVQEFYDIMKEQNAVRSNSIKPSINVCLPSLYEIDQNPTTFDYLRKLQNNIVPFIVEFLVDSHGDKKIKVFEILYGVKLSGHFQKVFEGFLALGEVSFDDCESKSTIILKKFLDTLVLEYVTILFFSQLINSIVGVVIEWTDIDNTLSEIDNHKNSRLEQLREPCYVRERCRTRVSKIINKKLSSYPPGLLSIAENIFNLDGYIRNKKIQAIVVIEILNIWREDCTNLPHEISMLLKRLYIHLANYYSEKHAHDLLIEYFFDYMLRKFIVLFSQTQENIIAFYIHR